MKFNTSQQSLSQCTNAQNNEVYHIVTKPLTIAIQWNLTHHSKTFHNTQMLTIARLFIIYKTIKNNGSLNTKQILQQSLWGAP